MKPRGRSRLLRLLVAWKVRAADLEGALAGRHKRRRSRVPGYDHNGMMICPYARIPGAGGGCSDHSMSGCGGKIPMEKRQ